jgi:hypothetical protein
VASTPTPRTFTDFRVENVSPPDRSDPSAPTETPKPARPTEALPPEPITAPKPTGTARDIKLQLAGTGPQRVEVHLSERAGQVQVAVRTPDSHLAGTLRDNLPTLSARLAESGIRAETWHPSAPAEWRRTTETSQANLAQDHNPQSGGQHQEQQSGGDPRRPKVPDAPMERKEKGKDFAWLMSTLQ